MEYPAPWQPLIEGLIESVLVVDCLDLSIRAVNRSACRLLAAAENDLIGHPVLEFAAPPEDLSFWEDVAAGLADGVLSSTVVRRADGSIVPVERRVSRVILEDGNPAFLVGINDLTERLAANKRIEELAYHDTLTGLPNRTLLRERIEFVRQWSARAEKSFALLFVDLDRFKQINDSLGHLFGDRVLVAVAERIKGCLRQCDTAARLGGDEFVLVLHDVDERGAEITAQRLIAALNQPLAIDDLSLTVTCSIGIALYPADGQTADDLIRNADTAMYRVKEHGRADFRFYQRQTNVDLLARMRLDQAMRRALEQGDFRLHYQPRVDFRSGRIVGAEALLRWRDRELGDIPPGRFIPLAEDSGLIIPIGMWVLNEAVAQAAAWRRRGIDVVAAVNVSALQFRRADFVPAVAAALQQSGLPPAALELELTESVLMQDAGEALLRLRALAELGVQLAIDDFGTGYSSLAYLKRFPIHKLKIDGSFVAGLPEDGSDNAIVTAVVNLGRALMLEVVAEGVETEGQRRFLKNTGCDQFQGFLFSPGVEPQAFERLFPRLSPRALEAIPLACRV
ncbi:MAG: diguanylate cyclase [Rhodocyclaceae bacterium]|nr:diguanylate cyclase [Rhodocyclaceae bacterium]